MPWDKPPEPVRPIEHLRTAFRGRTLFGVDVPETRYARSGEVSIAYQALGDGPPDLVLAPPIAHLELDWESPSEARFYSRLASTCRLILFNLRGVGMSDRITELATLESRMDDIRAVMDATASERAVIFGLGDAGPLCVLFAATYPERTAALVLFNSSPRFVRSPQLPWLPTRAEQEAQERSSSATGASRSS